MPKHIKPKRKKPKPKPKPKQKKRRLIKGIKSVLVPLDEIKLIHRYVKRKKKSRKFLF